MKRINIVLYDTGCVVGELYAGFGQAVHSWHPKNPEAEHIITYPSTGGTCVMCGGDAEDFTETTYEYLKMTGNGIGSIMVLHSKADPMLNAFVDRVKEFMDEDSTASNSKEERVV